MADDKDKVAAVETEKTPDAPFATHEATVTKESGASGTARAAGKDRAIEKAAAKA